MKVTLDMPAISKCTVTNCTYNLNQACHARAITVGDATNPGCDTFFQSQAHVHNTRQIAGVGACKVSECRYNNDFECSAASINVGIDGRNVRCMTYDRK